MSSLHASVSRSRSFLFRQVRFPRSPTPHDLSLLATIWTRSLVSFSNQSPSSLRDSSLCYLDSSTPFCCIPIASYHSFTPFAYFSSPMSLSPIGYSGLLGVCPYHIYSRPVSPLNARRFPQSPVSAQSRFSLPSRAECSPKCLLSSSSSLSFSRPCPHRPLSSLVVPKPCLRRPEAVSSSS
jgi:hypothetical protein